MILGKLINNILNLCPEQGKDSDGKYHTNLKKYCENKANHDGWKEVIYTDKPEGNYAPSWEIQNNQIIQIWTEYTPEPEPINIDIEKMRSDIDYIAMMTDIDLESGF